MIVCNNLRRTRRSPLTDTTGITTPNLTMIKGSAVQQQQQQQQLLLLRRQGQGAVAPASQMISVT
jgi:hypothetical protein